MTRAILLTSAEVADLRGITQRQVQRLAQNGLLKVAKVGPRNTQYFRKSDALRVTTTLR